MNHDARVTLYGGAVIGITLAFAGALTSDLIMLTGLGMMGSTLAVSALFDHAERPS